MAASFSRRRFLEAAGLATFAGLPLAKLTPALASALPNLGEPTPFNFTRLSDMALRLSAEPYQPTPIPHADRLQAIDFDTHNKIRFRSESALWADGTGPYPIELFHPGRYFKEPIRLFMVDRGMAREVHFDPALFSYGESPALADLPSDLGFAGFRVLSGKNKPDWLAFLGASYFRSSGESGQFGLSARGLAIDTAMPSGEEFPRFTSFWLDEPGDGSIVISALLDSPSIAGAYRIRAVKEKTVVMEIQTVLYPRKPIARMGIAPLTSMFWYSESSRRTPTDWRPQVHDSDGLAIWTGSGEHIWRPLNNPPGVQTSSFFDRAPHGFGLLQRNRDFANYQDDGVFYEKRPSAWIEPLGDWGAGAVQLVEIPTLDETHDNIVAYWIPSAPIEPGSEWRFSYRLTWADREPVSRPLASVIATRLGIAGQPGMLPTQLGGRKFVVDFAGGPLDRLPRDAKIKAVINVAHGEVKGAFAIQVIGTHYWRAFFDYHPSGKDPLDIRLYLELDGNALSETWLFQYLPGVS